MEHAEAYLYYIFNPLYRLKNQQHDFDNKKTVRYAMGELLPQMSHLIGISIII